MKKGNRNLLISLKYILTILLFLSVNSITAQLDFGIKAGLNIANFNTESDEFESFTAYHIGIFTNIDVSDLFSFQPGALYSIKGAKTIIDGNEANYNLSYLEIPINLASSFGKFNVFAGPYFAFGLEGNIIYETEREKIQFVYDEKDLNAGVEHGISMVDLGLNIGLGYEINKNITLQGAYGIGLYNLNPKINGESPKLKSTNEVLQFSIVLYL